jgi:hypothetical protein
MRFSIDNFLEYEKRIISIFVTVRQRTRRPDVERGATLHFSPDRDMREGSCRGE